MTTSDYADRINLLCLLHLHPDWCPGYFDYPFYNTRCGRGSPADITSSRE